MQGKSRRREERELREVQSLSQALHATSHRNIVDNMPPSNGSAAILTGLLSSSYAYTTNLIVRRNKQRTTALLDSETAAEPRTTLLPEYYEDAMIIGALVSDDTAHSSRRIHRHNSQSAIVQCTKHAMFY